MALLGVNQSEYMALKPSGVRTIVENANTTLTISSSYKDNSKLYDDKCFDRQLIIGN